MCDHKLPLSSQFENTKISLNNKKCSLHLKRTDNSRIMLRDIHFYLAISYFLSKFYLVRYINEAFTWRGVLLGANKNTPITFFDTPTKHPTKIATLDDTTDKTSHKDLTTPRTKHHTKICHPGQNISCSSWHTGQNIPCMFPFYPEINCICGACAVIGSTMVFRKNMLQYDVTDFYFTKHLFLNIEIYSLKDILPFVC